MPGGVLPALVVGLALVVASLVTWRTSNALFTATTTNGTNNFSTGSVTLSDNDSGTALFNVTGMKPGATGSACIRVSYSGTLASSIKVYGTGETATNSLDTYLSIAIDQGTNSSSTAGACGTWTASTNYFTGNLNTIASTFATGYGSWTPSSAATQDYRITYTLSSSAPNSTMSSTASVTFTWEAQNT